MSGVNKEEIMEEGQADIPQTGDLPLLRSPFWVISACTVTLQKS